MKNNFNPANLCQREVRCFYLDRRQSGQFLILIFFIILILPVFNWVEGEIKKKIKIRIKSVEACGGHATQTTHHVPAHA